MFPDTQTSYVCHNDDGDDDDLNPRILAPRNYLLEDLFMYGYSFS